MAENTADLLAALALAEVAPEPGGLQPSQVVHPGDVEVPAAVAVASVSSAGYVYIYDTRTGDRSLTNRNMLPNQLKKVRPDGSRVFTVVKPPIEPAVGHIKCHLHVDGPNRAHYTAMGFAVCSKDNLISDFHLERHMARSHRAEWAAILAERVKAEKAEDRAFQRAILDGRGKGKG